MPTFIIGPIIIEGIFRVKYSIETLEQYKHTTPANFTLSLNQIIERIGCTKNIKKSIGTLPPPLEGEKR